VAGLEGITVRELTRLLEAIGQEGRR
jgi:hypothetical protein